MTHEELKKCLKVSYLTKLSTFIWGSPGIGKSWIVRDVAKEIGEEEGLKFTEYPFDKVKDKKKIFGLIDFRLLQIEPSEIKGVPWPDKDKQEAVWFKPDFFPDTNIKKGILLLDEINLAPQLIQGASYQLVLDRRIGKFVLPSDWAIFAAGNRSEDRSGVFDMGLALKSRFVHYDLDVPTVEEWTKNFAAKVGIDPRVIAYLSFSKDIFVKPDFGVEDPRWPNPRTWHFASIELGKVPPREFGLIEHVVGSCVGLGTGAKFRAFVQLSEKIDPIEVLKNPKKFFKYERQLKYSIIGSLASTWRERKFSRDFLMSLFEFACEIREEEPEYGVILMLSLRGANPNKFETLVKKKENDNEVSRFLKEYQELLLV